MRAVAVAWVVLLGVTALTILELGPPEVVPADAPPERFSAERALRHVEAIAREPRPVGSGAHARAREYIVEELASLGLGPSTQTTTGARNTRGVLLTAPVSNVLVRLQGARDGPAVLLVGHYDSVSTGPGASDNAHAVAALLETLRALGEGSALDNDLIVLFSDAEEAGLLGAQAFVDEHPWAEDVAVVLNFEARGTHGPAVMFETSPDNGLLVRQFLDAAPQAKANSFLNGLYRRLPNDTDFTVFLDAGFAGLNFAYGAGLVHYHTALDDLDRLDLRSLQHNGDYMLAMARRLGGLKLDDLARPPAVFFTLPGPIAVCYPQRFSLPLTVVVVGLLTGGLVVGVRRRVLSVGGVVRSFLAVTLCGLLAAAGVTGLWWLLRWIHDGYRWFAQGDTYNSGLYAGAFASLTVALTIQVQLWLGRRVEVRDRWAGALLLWLACLVAVTVLLPAGSHLLAWPLAAGSLGLAASTRVGASSSRSPLAPVAAPAAALAGVLLLVPTVYLLFSLTGLLAPGVVIAPIVLLLGLLVPLIDPLPRRLSRLVPTAGTLVCVALIVAGAFTAGPDPARPTQNSVCYGLNADEGTAKWVSFDPRADAWTGQFLTEAARRGSLTAQVPWVRHEALLDEAPAVALPPPQATILSEGSASGAAGRMRLVRLQVRSTRSAGLIVVWVGSEMTIAEVTVDGRRVDYSGQALAGGRGTPRLVLCAAPPADGLQLVLAMLPREPVVLNIVDVTPGLPEVPGIEPRPRPPGAIAKPIPWLTDSTLVSRSFVMPAGATR